MLVLLLLTRGKSSWQLTVHKEELPLDSPPTKFFRRLSTELTAAKYSA